MTSDAELVDAYLAHLSLKRQDISLDLSSLAKLQRAHLTKVPFENLDVYRGILPPCDAKKTVLKILKNRGGWCFENNGAFGWLLEQLGFNLRRYAGSVQLLGPSTRLGHLCLEVTVDNEPFLVDVGFGDSFMRPLRLSSDSGIQTDPVGKFELVKEQEGTILLNHFENGVRIPAYRITPKLRHLIDFEPVSKEVAVDPKLPFVSIPFASRLLHGGPDRVTLLKDKIKFRRDGVWEETPVSENEWQDLLQQWFGFRSG